MYIPETGMYPLHRGETVGAAGKTTNMGGITINIPVHIGRVSSDVDINRVAQSIARATKAELMNVEMR